MAPLLEVNGLRAGYGRLPVVFGIELTVAIGVAKRREVAVDHQRQAGGLEREDAGRRGAGFDAGGDRQAVGLGALLEVDRQLAGRIGALPGDQHRGGQAHRGVDRALAVIEPGAGATAHRGERRGCSARRAARRKSWPSPAVTRR